MCKNYGKSMDALFDLSFINLSSEVSDFEPDDIPKTTYDVWVLGKKYNAFQGKIYSYALLG